MQTHLTPSCHLSSQDPLEQSLWACGIRGRAELHKFWKTEVEADMQRLQRKAMKLHEEPVSPSLPPPPPPPLSRPLSLSLPLWATVSARLPFFLTPSSAILAPSPSPFHPLPPLPLPPPSRTLRRSMMKYLWRRHLSQIWT